MGIGIFDRLDFPASMANNTIVFSENTQKSLANLPPILTTWQMEDIANSNTFGYFTNPVGDLSNNIQTVLTQIEFASNGVVSLSNVSTNANSSVLYVQNFYEHTNRISGITPFDANTAGDQLPLQPYYNDCIGIGKALTYLIYQSDGISNNAVIMGSFGSLYTSNNLTFYYNTLSGDLISIQNSIIPGPSPEDPPTTNLSAGKISQITSNILAMNAFVINSRTQDVTFYYNSRAVLQDYNSVKGFTRPGDSEKYLYEKIASDKLKERIT
jgi:hypothetical protein